MLIIEGKYMKTYSYFGAMMLIFTTPLFAAYKHTELLCKKTWLFG
jgi:hypothetical protein